MEGDKPKDGLDGTVAGAYIDATHKHFEQYWLELVDLLELAGISLVLGSDEEKNRIQMEFFGKPGSEAYEAIKRLSHKNTSSDTVEWIASMRGGQMVWTDVPSATFLRTTVLQGVLRQHKEDRDMTFSFN